MDVKYISKGLFEIAYPEKEYVSFIFGYFSE